MRRPSVDDAVDAMRGDEKFRAKLTQFAKHGLDRHAEFFDAPLSEAEVLEGHSFIMRGLRGADSLWRRCVPIMITQVGRRPGRWRSSKVSG